MVGILLLCFKLRHQTGNWFLAASPKTLKPVCNVMNQVILFRQLNSDTLAIVIMAVNLSVCVWLRLFSFCPLLFWILVNQSLNCIWKEQFQFSSAEDLYAIFQANVNFHFVLSDLRPLKSLWKGSCWFQNS